MGRHRRPSSSAGSAAQGRARPGDTGATEQYPADGPPPGATRPAPRPTAPGTTPVPPPLAPEGVRGGHPEQREPGGGWGGAPYGPAAAARRGGGREMPGPRQEYLDAFEDEDLFAPGAPRRSPVQVTEERDGRTPGATAYASGDFFAPEETPAPAGADGGDGNDEDGGEPAGPDRRRAGRGWAAAGIGAAAVVTVLAVVVGGQLLGGQDDGAGSRSAADHSGRAAEGTASRSEGRPTPASPAPAPKAAPGYQQRMGEKLPLDPDLTADGDFAAVRGIEKAPGKGRLFRYRVDVEKGLGLDGKLFAEAVQKTLNDDRSWSHDGARTFERIDSGQPDFVITLASPGTTAEWCAKSGLDTTIDNVSCDSASTDRVMINAYRWAQGAETYGDAIHAYRQMLINHEIGHRLGFNHVSCSRDGALAPVMQQQTKFLSMDGITCKANPWAYPN
ncbi:DUF3152 domain-containing protein [Streptomyces albidoflavus]|uniref:DUF3152 domain-containing protein n=1 Tax=Streptomyces albidoflavus TaxID=1886 RepID=UPI00101FE41B|nr:DUF3152 domain-containing protein [Streptomyces albidoflavus]RZD65703.1 hypothetical protein C0Q59_07880 [Streptomyces albidoflavus]RZF08970.1 hypothetical protein C0R05_09400 [Streptomyces albidoflavus]